MSKTADTYACIICHKTRRGRFTRPATGLKGSWSKGDSQGRSIPNWYCYTCLPQGQGRDEENDMPKIKDGEVRMANGGVVTADGHVGINIEREHQRGLALVNPIIQQLEGLAVTDEASFLHADEIVGEIRRRRKAWEPIWGAIQKYIVKPQREALEGAYIVNREVDGPLEKAETKVKALMADYKNQERLRIEQENRARDEEAERVQEQIEATRKKLESASGSVKGVLTRNLNRLENHQQTVIETVPLPVLGVNSSSRVIKSVAVDNLSIFAVALNSGSLKDDPIKPLIMNAINSVLRSEGRSQEARDIMAQWPGLKLVDNTQIVGH